jgi:hypothetical protein
MKASIKACQTPAEGFSCSERTALAFKNINSSFYLSQDFLDPYLDPEAGNHSTKCSIWVQF